MNVLFLLLILNEGNIFRWMYKLKYVINIKYKLVIFNIIYT